MVDQETTVRVGFIGAGRMATALARGLCQSGFATPEAMIACDVVESTRQTFQQAVEATVTESISDVMQAADLIVIAVKPQQLPAVLQQMQPCLKTRHLVVSIAAGVRIAALLDGLGKDCRLIRVMPNTPCLVGSSASGFALGGAATREDGLLVERMLSTVGVAVSVDEKLLDAITGLSGSGPAYVYQIIEALSDGGVRVGLPRDIATRLAAQTVLGAARMVLETGQHPGELKDAVTSPGGTTIAGIHALEQGGLRACLMNAVQAATERSVELGQSS